MSRSYNVPGWNKVEKTYTVWVFDKTADAWSSTFTPKDARRDAYEYLMSVKKGRAEVIDDVEGVSIGLATMSPKRDKVIWYNKKNGRKGYLTPSGNVSYP